MGLIMETFPVYPLGCNCTILVDTETKEAVVIDPGGDEDKIALELHRHHATVKSIVHTHAHFDHIMGTRKLAQQYHNPDICLHKNDLFLYTNLAMQCHSFGIPAQGEELIVIPVSHFIEDNETIEFGGHRLEVIHTPGHSPGSVCYSLETTDKQILFSGDTLFQNSIGRTDLWGGDSDEIIKSIKKRIFVMTDAEVIPGHGGFTTVYHEKKYNPFLQ